MIPPSLSCDWVLHLPLEVCDRPCPLKQEQFTITSRLFERVEGYAVLRDLLAVIFSLHGYHLPNAFVLLQTWGTPSFPTRPLQLT